MAIKYPLTVGHKYFWNLRSEMHDSIIKQRYGLYLDIFLSKIGKTIRKEFEKEVLLINTLDAIADIAHNNIKYKNNEAKLKALHSSLDELNEVIAGNQIPIPFNFKLRINKIISQKCKFMKSKKKPLWLVMQNAVIKLLLIYLGQ